MVAIVCALDMLGLFSLFALNQLFSLLELWQLSFVSEMHELSCLLGLLNLAVMVDPLLPPTRGLLPMLNGVLGGPPLVTEVPPPLTQVLPIAGEGLATVLKVASSLRLTEGRTDEPYGGEKVLLVPGAEAAAEDAELDNFKATASWRACASKQQQGVTSLQLHWALPKIQLIHMTS